MRVSIHGLHLRLSPSLSLYVQTRLNTALRRFEPSVSRVAVRLSDANGKRGGIDKICRIEVSLGSAGTVVVEHTDANAYLAIDDATTRLKHLVARRLRHRWESHRPRHAALMAG